MKTTAALLFLLLFTSATFADVEIDSFSHSLLASQPTTPADNLEILIEQAIFTIDESVTNSTDLSVDTVNGASTGTPQLLGRALCYPNPFRFSKGAHIGYMLTQDMDIELRVYSTTAHLMAQKTLVSGVDEGAKQGYNRVPINSSFFGADLPAGIYIYILIYKGKIIGKDKMAVLP